MAQYSEGSIVIECSLETKELLENANRAKSELIKLGSSGGDAAKGLDKVDKSAKSTGDSLNKITTIAKAVSAALVSSKIIAYAESWNELEDRIQNTGATAKETKDILDQLLETSNRNGRKINESAELYIKLSNSMKELGFNTNDTLDYIDTLSNLMTINKTSVIGAESAINALTKAQMKGKLSGEEANSVFNAMPSILKTLGTQLKKNEAEVRAMAANGKLSMKQFTDAMIAAQDETAKLADNMRNNIGDGLNRIENNLKRYLGEMNNTTGATKLLVDSLILVSEHVDILVNSLGVLAAIYAGKYITSLAAATKQSAEKVIANVRLAVSERNLAKEELKSLEIEGKKLTARRNELVALKSVTTSKSQLAVIQKQLNNIDKERVLLVDKEAVAQARLAATTKLSTVAMNGLKGAMNLLGGPTGILLIAAGALMSWSSSANEAKQKAIELTDEVAALTAKWKGMSQVQREAFADELKNKILDQNKAIEKQMGVIDDLNGKLIINKRDGEDTYGKTVDIENQIVSAKKLLAVMVEGRNKLVDSRDELIVKNYEAANSTDKVTESTNVLAGVFDKATKSKIADTIKDLSTQLEITEMKLNGASKEAYIYENALKALGDKGDQYKSTLKGILDGSIQWIKLSEEVRAALEPLISILGTSYEKSEKLKASQKSSKATTKTYADEIKTLRDKLEVAKLEAQGLTVEAELLSVAQQVGSKATAAQTAELRELIATSQAYKALESLKSPIDAENDSFKKSKESLDKLFQLGELKQGDYNSKIEQLEQKHQIEMAKIKSEATVSNVDNAVAMVDPVQALKNEHEKKLALIQQFQEKGNLIESQALALREAANYQYEQNRINAQWEIWKNQSAANDFLASSLEGLASSATSTISGLASGTMNATEAMQNFANVILNEAIGSLVQMGLQYVKNAIIGKTASAAATAAQITEAVALTAVYQPLAMYASIATQGQAAINGAAGFATAIGTMKGVSIAGGREHGGPVVGNSMYRVGEGGKPEILMSGGRQYLIPGENGRVLSNKEMNSSGSGGNSISISVTQSITFEGGQDDNQSAQQTAIALKQAIKEVLQDEQHRSGGLLNKR